MLRWLGNLLLLSLGLSFPELAQAGPASRGGEHPNIVLLAWSDAELENLGFLGQGGATPNLDALVRSGTLFPAGTRTMARGRPTSAALLTGLAPHVSGAYTQVPSQEIAPNDTLAVLLHGAGYATLHTGKFREGSSATFGFDLAGDMAGFLEEFGGKQPLFLWWAPEIKGDVRSPELDRALGQLLTELDRRHLRDDTLFCLVTNGVPGRKEFSAAECAESQLRNPIAFVLPGKIPARTRDELVTPLDVFPTLLAYAGVGLPQNLDGRSLRPLLEGQALEPRTLFGAFYEPGGHGIQRDLRALTARDGRWKYSLFLDDVGLKTDPVTELVEIERSAGDQALFDLESDPYEKNDLFGNAEHAERLAELRAAVLAWWHASGGPELVLPFLPPPLGPPPKEKRPNLVLIVSDDQDYEHLGFLGNPRVHTPTLDALAKDGLVFPVAHVPMSRCRPSLAALLSGRWPQQTGVYDNDTARTLTRRDSLPNLLKAAGYATFQGGKFWEGSQLSMGFLEPKKVDTVFKTFVRENQDELFSFIDRQAGERPLFLWWAPMLPHGPFNPPERYRALFKDVPVPVPAWVQGDAAAFQAAERTAYAMEAWFDDGLAVLRAKLAAKNELENTLFVFLIDNGYANGLPSKGTVFEKGLRTPVFFSWPKGIQGGRTSPALVSSLDIYPTLLDFAGVPCPAGAAGISLRPLLEGREQKTRDALYGAVYRFKDRRGPPKPEKDVYAIYARTERWKFVLYLHDLDPTSYLFFHEFCPFPTRKRGDRNLYDLEQDPYERKNLAGDPAHAALMDELLKGCLAWWHETGGADLDLP